MGSFDFAVLRWIAARGSAKRDRSITSFGISAAASRFDCSQPALSNRTNVRASNGPRKTPQLALLPRGVKN